MKKQILAPVLLLLLVIAAAFKENSAGTYNLDMAKSGITWEGNKALGGGHTGTIMLKEGNLSYDGKKITSGTFTADMNTISNIDLDNDMKDKLVNHLKSPDFFEVATYPTAKFVISKVEPGKNDSAVAHGSLTIKGITNTISFPFTQQVKGNRMEVVAKGIKVDRTKFGIQFASKGLKATVLNKAINDEFILNLHLILLQ